MPILYTQDDYATMRKVARIVLRLNPYAKGYSESDIVAKMKRHAEDIADKPGYIGIYGFMITSYQCENDPEGMLRIKASVSDILFDD